MTKRPNSRVNLDRAIERLFGPYESSTEMRSVLANAVVGQMLQGADWEETYEAANVRHGVARSLDEAIVWANDLVGKLDDASRERPASSAP